MRSITVPSGIGDNVWLLQKLINQDERFNFILPNSNPKRGKQLFDLLPQVANKTTYSRDRITYEIIARKNTQRSKPLFKDIKTGNIYLSMNAHLENGFRIETFFPDLETSWSVNWQTGNVSHIAESDLKDFEFTVGIYGSSYSTTRAWGFWQEKEWLELIMKMHKINPKITFVLIGAEWDLDLGSKLIEVLKEKNISYFDTVGKSLAYVVEIMKRLNYAFYFPSGLPILSETLSPKTDCVMFYPPHLKKMIGSWRDPSRGIGFKETLFCSPDEIFDFVKNDYKLFDR